LSAVASAKAELHREPQRATEKKVSRKGAKTQRKDD